MSNIIDQAVKIVEANGFSDGVWSFRPYVALSLSSLCSHYFGERQA